MTLSRRRAWTGRIFALPFYIGLIFFVIGPIVQSIVFAFSDVKVEVNGFNTAFIGFENISYVLKNDQNYTTNLASSVLQLLWQVPVIIIAALFFALLLNNKFPGRTFVRAIFFLPVIIATGVVINILKSDVVANSILTGNIVSGGQVYESTVLQQIFVKIGLNSSMIGFFTLICNNMFDLLWQTGIQMIIFLAALQSIPKTLYEASSVEGATAWDDFFKITIPMISPFILVNLIYTVIDNFTTPTNKVMMQVLNLTNKLTFGWAAAMAWVYFLIIAIILFIVVLLFSKNKNN